MKEIKMILTNAFDPDPRVYKEAKFLVDEGYNVEILCWDRDERYIGKEIEVIDGINIKRFFFFSEYGSGIKQIFPYIRFIKACKKYLKNKKIDYLHCHDLDGAVVGYFINKRKMIFDMHELYGAKYSSRIRKFIDLIVRKLCKLSLYILYVNDEQVRLYGKKIKNIRKFIYLPNYPEKKVFTSVSKTESDKLRISYIGSVSNFNILKNLILAARNENVIVNINGIGVAYQKLKVFSANYKNVNITGKFKYQDIVKHYNNTDIMYCVYNLNTFGKDISYPVKFYESLITKTPLIVSKDSIIGNFVEENNIGFLLENNGSDVEEIKNLIVKLINNKQVLKEKITNLKKISNDYIWENEIIKLKNIYSN